MLIQGNVEKYSYVTLCLFEAGGARYTFDSVKCHWNVKKRDEHPINCYCERLSCDDYSISFNDRVTPINLEDVRYILSYNDNMRLYHLFVLKQESNGDLYHAYKADDVDLRNVSSTGNDDSMLGDDDFDLDESEETFLGGIPSNSKLKGKWDFFFKYNCGKCTVSTTKWMSRDEAPPSGKIQMDSFEWCHSKEEPFFLLKSDCSSKLRNAEWYWIISSEGTDYVLYKNSSKNQRYYLAKLSDVQVPEEHERYDDSPARDYIWMLRSSKTQNWYRPDIIAVRPRGARYFFYYLMAQKLREMSYLPSDILQIDREVFVPIKEKADYTIDLETMSCLEEGSYAEVLTLDGARVVPLYLDEKDVIKEKDNLYFINHENMKELNPCDYYISTDLESDAWPVIENIAELRYEKIENPYFDTLGNDFPCICTFYSVIIDGCKHLYRGDQIRIVLREGFEPANQEEWVFDLRDWAQKRQREHLFSELLIYDDEYTTWCVFKDVDDILMMSTNKYMSMMHDHKPDHRKREDYLITDLNNVGLKDIEELWLLNEAKGYISNDVGKVEEVVKTFWKVRRKNGRYQDYSISDIHVRAICSVTGMDPKHTVLHYDNWYYHNFKSCEKIIDDNGKEWFKTVQAGGNLKLYPGSTPCIESSAGETRMSQIIEYLRQCVRSKGYRNDSGNVLENNYKAMDFIATESILCTYLSPMPEKENIILGNENHIIYPYATNWSQMVAIKKALTQRISIIEGPPGTGKTATIRNIIANLIIEDKKVLVVSSSNYAAWNVMHSFGKEGFLFADMTSVEKKKMDPFHSIPIPEEMKTWDYAHADSLLPMVSEMTAKMEDIYSTEEEIAKLKDSLKRLDIEWKHCKRQLQNIGMEYEEAECMYPELKTSLENLKKRYDEEFARLESEIEAKKVHLTELDAEKSKEEFHRKSMLYFHSYLTMYRDRTRPEKIDFKLTDEFLHAFPVIVSTTYSARKALMNKFVLYDWVIFDESSQIDITTACLALSCARNAVIVGDSKQLPFVQDDDMRRRVSIMFPTVFPLGEAYDCSKYDLLASVRKAFPQVEPTLLKEHYRCHQDIIGYCNDMFYEGELIPMKQVEVAPGKGITIIEDPSFLDCNRTTYSEEESKNVVVNDAEAHSIKAIVSQCLEKGRKIVKDKNTGEKKTEKLTPDDIGVISPFRGQANLIGRKIGNKNIVSDTVHRFQGQERNTIVFGIRDSKTNKFSDENDIINVAVSRAVENFILLLCNGKQPHYTNVGALIDYNRYVKGEPSDKVTAPIFPLAYSSGDSGEIADLIDSANQKLKRYDMTFVKDYPLYLLIKASARTDLSVWNILRDTSCTIPWVIYNRATKEPMMCIVEGDDERSRTLSKVIREYGIWTSTLEGHSEGLEDRVIDDLTDILHTVVSGLYDLAHRTKSDELESADITFTPPVEIPIVADMNAESGDGKCLVSHDGDYEVLQQDKERKNKTAAKSSIIDFSQLCNYLDTEICDRSK